MGATLGEVNSSLQVASSARASLDGALEVAQNPEPASEHAPNRANPTTQIAKKTV
ncbi:MAG: hypothetical protein ACKOKH_08330 [Bacteroidota bacterium]